MTKTLCKSNQNDCCFLEGWDRLIFLNAYWCNLNICMLLQNAEWVQIGVMKLFHYGDEQCWINRNNGAQCFMEPAVAFWHQVLLCLQLCWTAWAWRWLLQKRDNRNSKHHHHQPPLDLHNTKFLSEFSVETITIMWFTTKDTKMLEESRIKQVVMSYSHLYLCI